MFTLGGDDAARFVGFIIKTTAISTKKSKFKKDTKKINRLFCLTSSQEFSYFYMRPRYVNFLFQGMLSRLALYTLTGKSYYKSRKIVQNVQDLNFFQWDFCSPPLTNLLALARASFSACFYLVTSK